MGLKGQLEDLPLLDMLQIIAFSKKSGCLRVEGAPGRGAVLLKEGRVLFAFSWSTVRGIRRLAQQPDRIEPGVVREHIEASLRELAGLREGSFQFELADSLSQEIDGIEITPFVLPEGLDPQELLLDLAVEIDNERREATTLLELAFHGELPPEEPEEAEEPEADEELAGASLQLGVSDSGAIASETMELEETSAEEAVKEATTSPTPESLSVVIVDDEPPVTEVVSQELGKKGYRVFTTSGPSEGAEVVRERVQSGEKVLLVVDLKMPTSSGRSFYGGFELIRRTKKIASHIPTLLMVESLSEKSRLSAKELGIRRLVYKPTLTKPDPELYRADLVEFAERIHGQLEKLVEDAAQRPEGNGRAERAFNQPERMEFLAAMTRKLVRPGGSTDISRLVLEVAARFLERGILFVIKSDQARGLAGFGIAGDENECAEIAQDIAVTLTEGDPISEVVRTGTTLRVTEGLPDLGKRLHPRIGRGRATEAVLIPMLYNRATLLLLYADNAASGRPLGDLGGLELFMAQAGMALENKLLQRKLGSVDPAASNVSQGAQT